MKKALKGLLLVGGKSSRMGSDKSQLVYRDHQPEWRRLSHLMDDFCDEVYLCCPRDQTQQYDSATLVDTGDGPLAAIASADLAQPGNSWLVVACDLPLLDFDTISDLVNQRDLNVVGTYYTSAVDGKPEPLCAVYETHFFPEIHESLRKNHHCPRNLLLNTNAKALNLRNPQALKNANTPAEKLEIESILSGDRVEKIVNIRYFAQLKEIAGVDSEELTTTSLTPAGVYEELQIKYRFPHKPKQLMLAINDDFADWNTQIMPGDEIVFIPPVAGG